MILQPIVLQYLIQEHIFQRLMMPLIDLEFHLLLHYLIVVFYMKTMVNLIQVFQMEEQ